MLTVWPDPNSTRWPHRTHQLQESVIVGNVTKWSRLVVTIALFVSSLHCSLSLLLWLGLNARNSNALSFIYLFIIASYFRFPKRAFGEFFKVQCYDRERWEWMKLRFYFLRLNLVIPFYGSFGRFCCYYYVKNYLRRLFINIGLVFMLKKLEVCEPNKNSKNSNLGYNGCDCVPCHHANMV